MATNAIESVAEAAKKIYQDKLRESLEVTHLNQFVAIEPVSGGHFIGSTLSAAIGASREKYPDRLPHAFRIGHKAAFRKCSTLTFGCRDKRHTRRIGGVLCGNL